MTRFTIWFFYRTSGFGDRIVVSVAQFFFKFETGVFWSRYETLQVRRDPEQKNPRL